MIRNKPFIQKGKCMYFITNKFQNKSPVHNTIQYSWSKFSLTGSGCITGAGFFAFKNPGFGGRAGAGGGHWTEGK